MNLGLLSLLIIIWSKINTNAWANEDWNRIMPVHWLFQGQRTQLFHIEQTRHGTVYIGTLLWQNPRGPLLDHLWAKVLQWGHILLLSPGDTRIAVDTGVQSPPQKPQLSHSVIRQEVRLRFLQWSDGYSHWRWFTRDKSVDLWHGGSRQKKKVSYRAWKAAGDWLELKK